MKSATLIVCLCIMAGCSSTASQETTSTTSQDTVKAAAAASDSLTDAKIPEAAFAVTDSAANVLKVTVDAQFDTLYKALADSASYYKVVYVDYYDEYEGQDELERNTWYFDKEFNIVYATYSYQNGAMGKPDVTEYLTKNNLVIAIKNEKAYDARSDYRSYTRWSAETDGLIINWSHYFKKAESIEPLPKGYVKESQDDWNLYLSTLQSMMEKEGLTEGEGVYTILIETPKQSELVDYEKLVIPKEVYGKLRAE